MIFQDAHINYYKSYRERYPSKKIQEATKATFNYIYGLLNKISNTDSNRDLNPNELKQLKGYTLELVDHIENLSYKLKEKLKHTIFSITR